MGNILSTGVSGLLAFQQALDVTSNNIANAATPGYSVENIELDAPAGAEHGRRLRRQRRRNPGHRPLLQRAARAADALLAGQLCELQHARDPGRPDRQHAERLEHRAHGEPAELRQRAADALLLALLHRLAPGALQSGAGAGAADQRLQLADRDLRLRPRAADRLRRQPGELARERHRLAQYPDRGGPRRRRDAESAHGSARHPRQPAEPVRDASTPPPSRTARWTSISAAARHS